MVLGLTNGPGFTPNPCLPDMVDWVRERELLVAAYAVGSFPDAAAVERYGGLGPFDGSTREGALANTGYQQARFNVTSMLRTGLETPVVWIDVEPVPDFEWSGDLEANAAVVAGWRVAIGRRATGSGSTRRRCSGTPWSATCRSASPSGAPQARRRWPRR